MERFGQGVSRNGWSQLVRIAPAFAVAVVAMGGTLHSSTSVGAQFSETCNIGVFHNARIAWGDVEHALAAPEASAEVVDTLSAEIQQVYRPDGTMSMQALESLLTPALREVTGMDCGDLPGTPSPAGPAIPDDQQVYLDQVRQVDEKTVAAFLVLPDRMFQPAPGATPGAVGIQDGTPLPDTEIVDAVQFLVFKLEDGTWKIDYLSDGVMVVFSDVAPKGQAPSDNFIGSWTYPAADLRDHGMPAVPEGSEVVASPVATPAS
ncbi:MAG: hypothetical protein QM589_01530 [Thermomicrobiales bacterium]